MELSKVSQLVNQQINLAEMDKKLLTLYERLEVPLSELIF